MRREARGFTLIEVTIILMVLAILGFILLPSVERILQVARIVRVSEDLQVIGTAIILMLNDIGESGFYIRGAGSTPVRSDENRIELLISNGDIPSGNGTTWVEPWLRWFNIQQSYFDVDFLENHLCTNNPGSGLGIPYRRPSTPLSSIGYTTLDGFARTSQGYFNAPFAWRGAYLTAPIYPDPWGNRYMVNVQFLDPQPDRLGNLLIMNDTTMDVFVLSAGPDEQVDTPYAMDGVTPGDDDRIFVLSGGAR